MASTGYNNRTNDFSLRMDSGEKNVWCVSSKTKLAFKSRRGSSNVSSKHFHPRLHTIHLLRLARRKGLSCLLPFYRADAAGVGCLSAFCLIHAAGAETAGRVVQNGLYILFIVTLLGLTRWEFFWEILCLHATSTCLRALQDFVILYYNYTLFIKDRNRFTSISIGFKAQCTQR